MAANEMNFGGGSGGDAGMDSSGNNLQSASGTYQIGANQVVLVSRKPLPLPPTTKAGPSRIIILAGGGMPTLADDGEVDVRGAKCVRITSGPPALPMIAPPASISSGGGNGVEIEVSTQQSITLDRGDPLLSTSQSIYLAPGKIIIDAGLGEIIMSSLTKITLAAGANSITLDAVEGITIQGLPFVQINPTMPVVPPDPLPPLPDGEAYA